MTPPEPTRFLAVVDVGSQSVSVAVYPLEGERPLRVGPRYKVTTCLVQGPQQYPATLDALQDCRTFLAPLEGAYEVVVVGTEATRQAQRTEEGRRFLAQVQGIFRCPVFVVTGEQEALLCALGGVLLRTPTASGVSGDLGGGSLDLAHLKNGEVQSAWSVPLGVLTFLSQGYQDIDRALKTLHTHLAEVPWLSGPRRVPVGGDFYALGGTWRTVGRWLQAVATTRPATEGLAAFQDTPYGQRLRVRWALEQLDVLARTPPEALEHHTVKKVRKRAESLPLAASLLKVLLEVHASEGLVIEAGGLREGVWAAVTGYSLIPQPEGGLRVTPPSSSSAQARSETLRRLGLAATNQG